MKKTRTSSELYKFLETGGYLETPEKRKLGAKLFRKRYLLLKKQEYRKLYVEHCITLKPEHTKVLSAAAERHHLGIVPYIRMAAIAYTNQQYIVPRTPAIIKIEQQYIYARTQIDRISKEKQGIFGKSKSEKIEAVLIELNDFVRAALYQPQNLDTLIIEALQQNPGYAERLKQILADAC